MLFTPCATFGEENMQRKYTQPTFQRETRKIQATALPSGSRSLKRAPILYPKFYQEQA
jgi:hypothetical protein